MMKALLVVAAGLVLAACGGPTSGTITGKQYDASYTYYVDTCVSYGKYGCTVYAPLPETQPECWEIDLKNGDDTGSVCVDQKTFDQARIGQSYP